MVKGPGRLGPAMLTGGTSAGLNIWLGRAEGRVVTGDCGPAPGGEGEGIGTMFVASSCSEIFAPAKFKKKKEN